eukprot:4083920-Pyramimonas_sp.AAC.1
MCATKASGIVSCASLWPRSFFHARTSDHAVPGADAAQGRHHRLREGRGRWPHGHVGRPIVAALLRH